MTGTEVAVAKGLLDIVIVAYEEGWIDKLLNVFRKRHKVLVLGASGVGKTQMIRSLTKMVPDAISYMNRTQFIERKNLKISDELFEFIEAPGDLPKDTIRRDAYNEAIRSGIAAIMNVVAYGYHEYRFGNLDSVFTPKGGVRKKYLETHRAAEIDMLHEWDWQLLDKDVTQTLVTVVAKADIWWDNNQNVLDYYNTGPYYEALMPAPVHHAVLPYSSRKHKMFGKGRLSANFDDTDRIDLRAALLQHVLAAIGRVQ